MANHIAQQIYQRLSSVRLFLALLAIVLLLSALATIIPQGLDEAEYIGRFGALGTAILQLFGLTGFFRSAHLLALVGAMELNLILCTVPRLTRRLRRRARPITVYGPDMIHIGLILALAGGVVSGSFRTEREFLVPNGTEIVVDPALPPVAVVDSREVLDAAGNVVDWVITLNHAGREVELAINNPIRLAGYRFHFYHWGREPVLILADPDGTEYEVDVGEGLRAPDGTAYIFAGTTRSTNAQPTDTEAAAASDARDDATNRTRGLGTGRAEALIEVRAPDGTVQGRSILPAGGRLGQLTAVRIETEVLNGFTARRDPGRPIVIAGLFFIVLGMGIYTLKLWRSYG